MATQNDLETQLQYACKVLAMIAAHAGGEYRLSLTESQTMGGGTLKTFTDPATGELVIQYKLEAPVEDGSEESSPEDVSKNGHEPGEVL